MRHLALAVLFGFAVPPCPAAAQAGDSVAFTVVRASDTVAVERFTRKDGQLEGELVLPPNGNERMLYRATLLADATAPLVEIKVWRGMDPENAPPRQQTRVIFKGDSVAVDDITSRGLKTLLFETRLGAVPYLNLSFAFLEQATMRARSLGGDSVAVPFFSLSGGQTVTGTVRRVGADSATVDIGSVRFQLQVDDRGHILGGGVPEQHLRVVRN